MSWIAVTLEEEEKKALYELAERERRDMRAQAALIIRDHLEALGLLKRRDPLPITAEDTSAC